MKVNTTAQILQILSFLSSFDFPFLPFRMALVLSSHWEPMNRSLSPNTARWTSPSSTTPASSIWPSQSLRQRTSLLLNRRATSHGRSTWCCCPLRSNGPRRACRKVRVLSSRKHSSFPGWNRRPWGTTPFASACTASDG